MANHSGADTAQINPDISTSRRNVLGALGMASVIVPAAALAGPYAPVDAKFWALHGEFKRCEAAWNDDADGSRENWERHSEIVHSAFSALLACPVDTSSAVLEKLEVCDWESVSLDCEPGDSLRAIRDDLRRMAKREH
jgi:hypothetical protein